MDAVTVSDMCLTTLENLRGTTLSFTVLRSRIQKRMKILKLNVWIEITRLCFHAHKIGKNPRNNFQERVTWFLSQNSDGSRKQLTEPCHSLNDILRVRDNDRFGSSTARYDIKRVGRKCALSTYKKNQ